MAKFSWEEEDNLPQPSKGKGKFSWEEDVPTVAKPSVPKPATAQVSESKPAEKKPNIFASLLSAPDRFAGAALNRITMNKLPNLLPKPEPSRNIVEKAADVTGGFVGEALPFALSYGTIGKAISSIPKIAKAGKLTKLAIKGGAASGAVGGAEAAIEGKSPVDIAKQAGIYGALGAVGDPLLEGLAAPLLKKGIQKVAPLLKRPATEIKPTMAETAKKELPKTKAATGTKERQFAQNVRESNVATAEVKKNLDVDRLTYEPITNKETFSKADALVKKDADKALEYFNSPSKGVNADDVAVGEALITKAIRDGNATEANRLIADLAEKLTTAGQAVQAASIFKKLTPEGMLLYAQRVVNGANKDLLARLGKKAKKVELIPDDSKFILDTMKKAQQLADGRQKDIEMARVTQFIANKVPATLSERLKGLQRITLLLNPKTMVRNTLGNVIFGAIDNVSNVIGTPIDIATSKLLKTGKRTTTLPSIKTQLKGVAQGAKDTIQDVRLGVDTYPGRTQYDLPSRRVFFNKSLDAMDRATKAGLQLGDRPFYQAAYDDTLRQQMKLAKVKEPTQEMIEMAHTIAQQRTYQDTNALTEAFKKAQSALNLGRNFGLGNVALPFVKTPANILKRAIEYSPVGVEKAIREATNLSKGTFNQKAFVDAIARSVTGTALIMVGYDLAKKGLITGSGNKDKDVAAFERGLGKNDYAYKVGDKYFTYDWAQPASMGIAIGADIFLKGKNREAAENVISEAIRSGGETLFKQSLLQGVQRLFGGYSPIENIANTASNAPMQLIPTFSKQLAQLTDPLQRSTYSPGGAGAGVNMLKSKIPELSKTLEPKISTLGEPLKTYQGKNNLFNVFLNPSLSTEFKPTKVQSEILRLYEATEDKDIFPKLAPRYFVNNKERITLTPREITKFQQTMGKKTEERMQKVIDNTSSDKARVAAFKRVIDLAYEDAKREVLKDRKKAGAENPR